MGRQALEGIRILELSTHWAAPYGVKMLSDMGAEVIKLEACQRPDVTRAMLLAENEPGERPWNRGAYFHKANRNKLGITLNLADPRGVAVCKRLYRICDAVVENFTPRVLRGMGLDYPVLKEINPTAIMLSNTAFGRTGPYGEYIGFGATAEAMGGLAIQTGYPDAQGYPGSMPRKVGFHYGDPVAGMFNAAALLVAIWHRRKTGRGQHIDMAMRETVMSLLGESILDYVFNGREPQRMGDRHPSMAPHGAYRCKGDDSWLVIAIGSDEEWARFRQAIGDPEWTHDGRFATTEARKANERDLDRLVESWTVQHEHREAAKILQEAGIAAGPVLTNAELLQDAHLRERGFFETIRHPEVGLRPLPGVAFKMSKTPGRIARAAPTLGEHNEHVFGELLGMSRTDLQALAEGMVIGTEPVVPVQAEPFPLQRWLERGIHVARIDQDYRKRLGIE